MIELLNPWFDSWAEFFSMDGSAFAVWCSYGLMVGGLALLGYLALGSQKSVEAVMLSNATKRLEEIELETEDN